MWQRLWYTDVDGRASEFWLRNDHLLIFEANLQKKKKKKKKEKKEREEDRQGFKGGRAGWKDTIQREALHLGTLEALIACERRETEGRSFV